jgi:hypothetical protein
MQEEASLKCWCDPLSSAPSSLADRRQIVTDETGEGGRQAVELRQLV